MHHRSQAPCKNCEERSISPPCHDRCSRYREYRKSVDKANNNRKTYRKENELYFDFVAQNVKRYKGLRREV